MYHLNPCWFCIATHIKLSICSSFLHAQLMRKNNKYSVETRNLWLFKRWSCFESIRPRRFSLAYCFYWIYHLWSYDSNSYVNYKYSPFFSTMPKINENTVSQRQQVAKRQVNKTPFAKMSEHMLFSVINITRLIMVNNLTYFVSYIRFQTCIRIKPIY